MVSVMNSRPFLTCPAQSKDNHVVDVEVLGNISEIETIVVGLSIRDLARLRKAYVRGVGESEEGLHEFVCRTAWFAEPRCTGMRLMELGRTN